MMNQQEHAESIQSIAKTLQQINEKLDGHTKSLLTVAEAARLVNRSEHTVRRWIKLGKLKAVRVKETGPRGRLLIRQEALVGLLAEGFGEDIPATAICATPTSTDELSR